MNSVGVVIKLMIFTFVYVMLARVFNAGYLTLIYGIFILLLMIVYAITQIIIYIRNRHNSEFRATLSWVTAILLCVSMTIMPDMHDAGSSMMFGMIHNPPKSYIQISAVMFVLGIIISLYSVKKHWNSQKV